MRKKLFENSVSIDLRVLLTIKNPRDFTEGHRGQAGLYLQFEGREEKGNERAEL